MRANREHRVCLVQGSDPVLDRDAVGQYTELLYKHISAELHKSDHETISVERALLRPYSSREWHRELAWLMKRCDLLHIEYPFEGWGKSPAPGLFPAVLKTALRHKRAKIVTTFHEWRSMHPLRKASILPLASSSDGVLFVASSEHNAYVSAIHTKLLNRVQIVDTIPIGVNLSLPELRTQEILRERSRLLNWGGMPVEVLLGHFGFIYAAKQPYKALNTVRSLLERGVKTRLVIVGDFPADHVREREAFYKEVEALRLREHVLCLGFLEDTATLATVLSACNAVLLLFTDGVSARNSSFWTILELGTPLITTRPSSQGEFDDLLPQRTFEDIVMVDPTEPSDLLATAVGQFEQFSVPQQRRGVSPSWEVIAKRHIAFYRRILDS